MKITTNRNGDILANGEATGWDVSKDSTGRWELWDFDGLRQGAFKTKRQAVGEFQAMNMDL